MSLPTTRQPQSASDRDRLVLIGGSAGGFVALIRVLTAIPASFRLPILVVQHLHPDDNGSFARHLANGTQLPVIEVSDKEPILPGYIYTAPANYHTLIEQDRTLALSLEGKVHWSRPSIDVLFESAAQTFGADLIAVILSGANEDGAVGMQAIKLAGGLTIAQNPATAEYPAMPQAAIDTGAIDEVLSVEEIGRQLVKLEQGR